MLKYVITAGVTKKALIFNKCTPYHKGRRISNDPKRV